MKNLKVDEKWSILYDPNDNDRPKAWLRYENFHSEWKENNPNLAMFYALLALSS